MRLTSKSLKTLPFSCRDDDDDDHHDDHNDDDDDAYDGNTLVEISEDDSLLMP